jgi:hypothetical protein
MQHVLPPCILKYNPGTFLAKILLLKATFNQYCIYKRKAEGVMENSSSVVVCVLIAAGTTETLLHVHQTTTINILHFGHSILSDFFI